MRLAPSIALALMATSAQAQSVGARCSPRVEASAAVPPSTVARLTASISGSSAVSGACPLVRLDLVSARVVMTVVLDDGRQVARVLPSLSDALPTLVALTATPLPPVTPEPEVVAADAVEALVPAPTPAVVAPAPVVMAPAPPVMAPRRPWQLRLGAAYGITSRERAQQGAVDVDLLLPRWAFGVRAGFDLAGRHDGGDSGASATLSVRPRWSLGRWQFDLGPAVSARWSLDERGGLTLRAGAEGSVGFALGRGLSVFTRIEGGADVLGRSGSRQWRGAPDRDRDEVRFSYGAVLGVRWALP